MRLLYISYSCDPYNGSEDQIGWNVPFNAFMQGNEVIVLTKAEHKASINKYLEEHPEIKIDFHYIDVPLIYKKVFKGLLYSARIILWQRRAYKIAKAICNENAIDVIHQVAPIEYRALGKYGSIQGVKFVAGPIGGGFPIPNEMKEYVKGHFFSEGIRRIANSISLIALKISGKFSKSDYTYFTNEETVEVFKKYHILKSDSKYELLCDVGAKDADIEEIQNQLGDKMIFLVPGRLYYRKGHRLLFDSLPREDLKIDYEIRIIGEWPEDNALKDIVNADAFLKSHVVFLGKVDYTQMNQQYKSCNVVVLPSLSEATGTVLIEALTYAKPIITGEYFGARILSEYNCGWFYRGENKAQLIESFNKCIKASMDYADLSLKSKCAIECAKAYSWDNKTKKFIERYKQLDNN